MASSAAAGTLPPAVGPARGLRPVAVAGALALLLVVFAVSVARLEPAARFGWYHDDTVYFASAQALAEGRGYLLPSLPGAPPQTKYPVLYSWLLSWVWRWQPAFPANLNLAVALTAACGGLFLLISFQLLRRLEGIGDGTALGITALCALHPNVLILSGSVLSDMPFAALALGGALLADEALRRGAPPWRAVLAGALIGLSFLTRSLGLVVLAGVLAAALERRLYRPGAAVLAGALPFLLVPLLYAPAPVPPPAWAQGGAWQTWVYYTSYWQFWKFSVPNRDVFLSMVTANLRYLLQAPATFCLFPPPGGARFLPGVLLCITLTFGIASGILRQARRQEWKPVHFVLLFYAAAVLVWNYAFFDRLLVMFLPLFYAGVWIEGRHLTTMLAAAWRPGRPASEKVVATLLSLALLGMAGAAARFYIVDYRSDFPRMAASRVAAMAERRQAYDWIRRETPPATRLIAYEDVVLNLYTGRAAMRPIAFSTEAFYREDESVLRRDLAHLTDTARGIGARYWVMTNDDFALDTGTPLIDQRIAALKAVLPVVFRSSGGQVQVYDLGCLQAPDGPGCETARAVLFPNADLASRR